MPRAISRMPLDAYVVAFIIVLLYGWQIAAMTPAIK